ncbi:MAG: zinc ribbon domain-containing protein [Capsulimonadaceae bacterium]|nr:zinc ribbon domain-containing protein [Capsulimonadaceae bacterium]
MHCPFCHSEIPLGSRTCPNCNKAIPAEPATTAAPANEPADPQTTQLYVVADRSKRVVVWVAIASVIVLLVIVAYSLNQSRVADLAERAPIDPAAIRTHPNADNAPASSDSAAQTSSATAISGYIDFLNGIEKRRTTLRQSFDDAVRTAEHTPAAPATTQGTALSTSAAATPVDFAGYQQDWQNVVRDFNSQQIPPGCEVLSNNYYRVLQDYVGLLSDIGRQSSSPDNVSKLQTDGQTKIQTDALTADQALQQACSAAHIAKPFTIASELTAVRTADTGAASATVTQQAPQ